MSAVFHTAALIPNTAKHIPPGLVNNLVVRLHEAGCTVKTPFSDAPPHCLVCVTDDELFDGADIICVLGGDGSIIDAARRSIGRGIPIVGINCGRLGYLAEIEINELSLIDQILAGSGTVEERIMLDVRILRAGGETVFAKPVLNDAVLSNGPIPRLLSMELFCDGVLAEKCFADGIIFSTPTGSTAYSLSAGGPVLDPCLDCISFTPICPQRMTSRPVIFSGASVLEMRNVNCRENRIYLSLDGHDCYELHSGDTVQVRRSDCKTSLIRLKNGGFLGALRRKLSNSAVNGGNNEDETTS